jgi:uncharacterized membrane protein YdjX (TVP38/TMEM64 family)
MQIYILAEVLAIPVVALTASSGYLFGLIPGTIVVLTCASIAASISFFLGRTFLRNWAQKIIAGTVLRCLLVIPSPLHLFIHRLSEVAGNR